MAEFCLPVIGTVSGMETEFATGFFFSSRRLYLFPLPEADFIRAYFLRDLKTVIFCIKLTSDASRS